MSGRSGCCCCSPCSPYAVPHTVYLHYTAQVSTGGPLSCDNYQTLPNPIPLTRTVLGSASSVICAWWSVPYQLSTDHSAFSCPSSPFWNCVAFIFMSCSGSPDYFSVAVTYPDTVNLGNANPYCGITGGNAAIRCDTTACTSGGDASAGQVVERSGSTCSPFHILFANDGFGGLTFCGASHIANSVGQQNCNIAHGGYPQHVDQCCCDQTTLTNPYVNDTVAP